MKTNRGKIGWAAFAILFTLAITVASIDFADPSDPVVFLRANAVAPVETTQIRFGREIKIFVGLDRDTVKDRLRERVGADWQLRRHANGNYAFTKGPIRIVAITRPTRRNPAPPGTRTIVTYLAPKLPFL